MAMILRANPYQYHSLGPIVYTTRERVFSDSAMKSLSTKTRLDPLPVSHIAEGVAAWCLVP